MTNAPNLDLFDEAEPTPARKGLSLGSIVLLAGIVVAAAVFGLALSRQQATQPTAGTAPDFTVTTFDGQTVRLSDFRGKVVVINFWASWCIPCKEEAPILEQLWQEYKTQDVVFLGLAYTDSNPLSFIEEYKPTYLNAPDTGLVVSDQYHIAGVPETFIIDRDGNIAEFYMIQIAEAAPGETPNFDDLTVTDQEIRLTLDRLIEA